MSHCGFKESPKDRAKMASFDYGSAAELFPVKSGRSSKAIGYMRFAHAADAIRYAIEELSPRRLLGTHPEVDEERFDGTAIRQLYQGANYPLVRRQDLAVAQCAPLNWTPAPLAG
jgi:hypothetical protein